MSIIEEKYKDHITSMSGQERIERSASLYASMKRILLHQVRQQKPSLEGRELQKALARRIYVGNDVTLKLIDQTT